MSVALRFFLGLVWLGAGVLPQALAQWPAPDTVRTEQVRAQLVAHAPQGLRAGATVWLGLRLAHAPHWHTYWQNPGDSGLPTRLQWQLPPGMHAGDIQWPTPSPIAIGELVNYGYEGTVLLRVPVTIGPDFNPSANGQVSVSPDLKASANVRVGLQAEWLVCRQACIPQEGRFALDLPVHGTHTLHGADFAASHAATPVPLAGAHSARLTRAADALQLRFARLPDRWRGQPLQLLPATAGVVHHGALQSQNTSAQASASASAQWEGTEWRVRVPVSPERSEGPAQMQWLIRPAHAAAEPARSAGADAPHAVLATTPVQGPWPALASAALPPALAQALATPATSATTALAPAAPSVASASAWAVALLGAFVGGLLLNLMPCVFPVLALKLLALANPSTPPAQRRAEGLAYTAGVLASVLLLGAAMLALRASGEQLGWGFQLQSPTVVAGLALLFALLGFNLMGWFEWGTWLPSRLASWQSPRPAVNAALSGLLAVAVASPCSAPFMGASMGVAMQWPAWQALGVFAALGLGMACPLLLASLRPQWARWLPRPGAWMHTLRQALAFPLFATVVWLLWVLGQQTDTDAVAAMLALVVLLGFALWALAQAAPQKWALLAVGAVCAFGLWCVFPPLAAPEAPPASTASAAENAEANASAAPPARWAPWSEATVQRELAQGHTVFVDFTAAWCVSCQYNKKTTLADARVWAAFEQRGVRTLRADWTRRDPAITLALSALGRSGVPLYVVYAPGRAPQLLPELPSVPDVLQALP